MCVIGCEKINNSTSHSTEIEINFQLTVSDNINGCDIVGILIYNIFCSCHFILLEKVSVIQFVVLLFKIID